MPIVNDIHGLEPKLRARIETRMREQTGSRRLDFEEIENVSELSTKLTEGVLLSRRDSDNLRRLASLSRVALKPKREIKSHRPVLGPLVVAFKKLTYPVVAFHMKDTVEALEEFAALSVVNQARVMARVEGGSEDRE